MFHSKPLTLIKYLYSQNEPPDLSRSTMKRVLYMAVSNVHFKCRNKWYVQKDVLGMGTSLTVIVANRIGIMKIGVVFGIRIT